VSLSEDVGRIAEAAARYAASGEELAAVVPVEPASGERVYLCAFARADGSQSWLGLDDRGSPLTNRTLIRAAASIAALVEVAEESAAVTTGDEPRLASPAYLDSLGAAAVNGDVAGALQNALPAIEELTRDLELNYKLELE
jgi:hypothetical protein